REGRRMRPEEPRPEQWDDIRQSGEGVTLEPPPSSSRRWIVVAVLLVAAAVAVYIVFGRRPEQVAAPSAPKPVAGEPRLGEAQVNLPPLDQSDAIVADLVRALSSHPRVTAWLTTEGLIRNFSEVVWTIADEKSPARLLRPLRPATPFRVAE